MNKYSTTTIEIASHRADDMIIDLWDAAYADMAAAIKVVTDGYDIPHEAVSGLVAGSLNAFEDHLREEFGIISRVPEGEE